MAESLTTANIADFARTTILLVNRIKFEMAPAEQVIILEWIVSSMNDINDTGDNS